jgi:UDP-glucose 4-epimerase
MKILVTGCAGFIGSHTVDRLLSEGYEVIGIDNFDGYYSPKIKWKNIENAIKNEKFRLVKEDVRDKKTLKRVLKDVDVVFHLAARPGVRASFKDPELYVDVNVRGTLNLLQACLDSDVKKLIYSSSSSVYGEPEYLPIDEKHSTNPISIYGATKLAAEKLCYVFHKTYGLKVIILRYFTVFGPRQRPDEAICKFTRLLLQNKKPEIYGDGNQSRDFTYIDNVIDANILAMRSKVKFDVFNIGSGTRTTVNQLVDLLNKACKTRIKPRHVKRAIGDVTHTQANIGKAKEILGYKPKIDVASGIKKYIEWFKNEAIRFDYYSSL